ncbi:MAG: choice-of-anchor tandem repeat GloVer-containing protein [Bryobacteraceae bacterium]
MDVVPPGTAGTETVQHSFASPPTGANPQGVIRDSAGNLYGTAYSGGAAGAGVVFKVDTAGKQTVLHSFGGGTDGATIPAVVALAGVRIAGLRVGAKVVGCVRQILTEAFRAGVAGLAIAADTVGWVAQTGIQDLAEPPHGVLRGGAVQAGQRRRVLGDNEWKRRQAVLSVAAGCCHG